MIVISGLGYFYGPGYSKLQGFLGERSTIFELGCYNQTVITTHLTNCFLLYISICASTSKFHVNQEIILGIEVIEIHKKMNVLNI